MRTLRRLLAALLAIALCPLIPARAQEWIEYVSKDDLFTVNFPAQPKVETIQWKTEFGLMLPAHVTRVDTADSHYLVTAIDYSNVQKMHTDRLRGCNLYPDQCNNPSEAELRGAMEYAAWQFLKRDAKVTYYAYGNTERIEGRRLQLTNADGSRTFGEIHMHANRLYIFEATVPKGAPSPELFQQSVGFIDGNGVRVRYNGLYTNGFPAPPRVQY